jgi:DNA-binding GntR family transcriptional regulator
VSRRHLARIEQSTLADEVVKRVHDAIVVRQLRPGERLTESELAEQLGVSRSPVREALLRLATDRLVDRTEQGTYVWEPTPDDVEEVFTLRAVLESLAAEWVIGRLEESDFDQLDLLIEEQLRAIEANDLVRSIAVDREFHGYICDATGYSRLSRWWNEIMGQWEVLLYSYLEHSPPGTPYVAIDDHRAIADALRRRDLDRVVELHKTLNRRVCDQVRAILSE